jgi:3-isopropylmalate/(R)-2-methylmalate dehydratase small subunit
MKIHLEGRARLLGDDINTDYIIASSRKKESLDPDVLKLYLLEAVDPEFAGSVRPGDLIVAGKNFGCGSAMEIAVTVLLAAGIKAVLARSFARTFYRNAVNNGLIPIECDTEAIQEGDRLSVDLQNGLVLVEDVTADCRVKGQVLPAIMLDILSAGGLVPYFRIYHDFQP